MEQLEQHCTCGVCLEIFGSGRNIPRTLNCGHTFCEICIEHLRQNEMRRDRIIHCPSCKNTQYLHTELPINYQILGLADDLRTKRLSNERWSLRKPNKNGLKCNQCNIPPINVYLRICRSCENNPILCPECALNNHNGHSFTAYESFLTAHRAEEQLKTLENLCETTKISTNEIFGRVIESIERLRTKCNSLSIPSSIRSIINENPSETLKQINKFIDVIEKSREEIIDRLNESEEFFDNQSKILDEEITSNMNDIPDSNIPPPVPPRRRILTRNSLKDRYEYGFSIISTLFCLLYIMTYFPLSSFCIILIIIIKYFILTPNKIEYERDLKESDEISNNQ